MMGGGNGLSQAFQLLVSVVSGAADQRFASSMLVQFGKPSFKNDRWPVSLTKQIMFFRYFNKVVTQNLYSTLPFENNCPNLSITQY